MVHLRQTSSLKASRRRYYPLLAILALVLASMACIDTGLQISVIHNEKSEDSLLVVFRQYLSPSYVDAARKANEQRANDFKAAKRPLTDPPLPESMADMKELFDIQKYQDMDYLVEETENGFTATEKMSLVQKQEAEDWIVEKIHDPKQPGLVTYRVKVYLDLTDLEGFEIFELRKEELGDPPDLKPSGGDVEMSGSPFGDMFSMIGSAAEAGEQEMEIELYYAHMALLKSDPLKYEVWVMLPGKITLYELDGKEAGTLDTQLNEVSLVIDEATIKANAGKKMVFHVESELKDCKYACQGEHIVWDGNEKSSTCDCVCEKGMFSLDDTKGLDPKDIECHDCNILCTNSERDLVIDLENCEPGICACMCKPPLVPSNDGKKCITQEESWIEVNKISEFGPSATELKEAVAAITDPFNEKDVNKMAGWFYLSSRERAGLLRYLEYLDYAVNRTNLVVSTVGDSEEVDYAGLQAERQARLKKVRQKAIDAVENEIDKRRRIQKWIIWEIGFKYEVARIALEIPDWISKFNGTATEIATNFIEEELTSTVIDGIKAETHGDAPTTIQEAAMVLISKIPEMATRGCVDDYYQYLKYFKEYCREDCKTDYDAQTAHELALKALRKGMDKQRLNWAKEGEAYDRAFWKINDEKP